MRIRLFSIEDSAAVIALWEACGLTRSWNNPELDIQRKLSVQPELFLVGELDSRIIASAMAGYDGHRGAVYYLGVHPDYQRRGFGRQLMDDLEQRLFAMGCPKLNILIRSSNSKVIKFYEALGYRGDDISCMGKRLIPDQ